MSDRRHAPVVAGVVLALAFQLLLDAGSAVAYSDLGLRPRWEDPAAETAEMRMRERLASIDAIEDRYPPDSAIPDSVLVDLVRLYRSSPLMKHRILALEWIEKLPPDLRQREFALTYRRTFNPWDAQQSVEKWIREAPDTASGHRWEGLLHFEEAMIGLEPKWFTESAESFRRATRAPDATLDDWRGLAAALTADRRYASLRPVAESMVAMAPDDVGANLYAALAHEAAGLPNLAAAEFELAMQHMDPAVAHRFREPFRVVIHEEGSTLDAGLVVPTARAADRGWWVRLIESEVLFGDPDAEIHAWDTAPGTAYLLFGRPEFMRAFRWAGVGDIMATPELSRYHDEIVRQMDQTRAGIDQRYWVWLVRTAEDRLDPLVFGQFTRFARWEPSVVAEVEMFEPAAKQGPLRLASSLPEIVELDGSVRLAVASAGFRTPQGRMRVESWVATDLRGRSDAHVVRLRLLAASGKEIDRVERALEPRYERKSFAKHLRGFPATAPGWLHGFGALVPPGEFLVLVDVLDDTGRVLASRDRRLRFEAEDPATSSLRLSQALLCDAYAESGDFRELPSELIRHARAVVPHPELQLHPGQREASVYYEIYGADLDEQGFTRLDVEYELFPERSFDPYVVGAGYVDGELQEPVFRAVFPEERTGAAEGGLVVKGTRLDVSGLEPGPHVLVIRVGDRIARQEATTLLQFVVPDR